MDVDKYIHMCQTFGDEIDEEKIPPRLEDLPHYVSSGIEIFNSLNDMYISGGMSAPIFSGKDLSALTPMFEIYQIDNEDRMKVLDVIKFLENRAREQSRKEAKKGK